MYFWWRIARVLFKDSTHRECLGSIDQKVGGVALQMPHPHQALSML